MPSPILIFGDYYTSKNQVVGIRKKNPDFNWITLSATECSIDEIVSEVGTEDIFGSENAFIIQDIPNNKEMRSFILDLISNSCHAKLIIWDSLGHIKRDAKTGSILKTWDEFVKTIQANSGSHVQNNGDPYTEKDIDNCVEFIKKKFASLGKKIDRREANMLIKIVGYDRGILDSEIRKLAFTSPDFVSIDFIVENAFPLTQESILWKFSNILDTGSYSKITVAIEEFLDSGINGNVLAEVMLKKARWQLATVSFYHKGESWFNISNKLMNMGNFPSSVWHSDVSIEDKNKASDKYNSFESIMYFFKSNQGLPSRFFKLKKPKQKMLKSGKPSKTQPKLSLKRSEKLPMKFIADQTVSFVKNKIIGERKSQDDKEAALNRAKRVYVGVYKHLVDVRLDKNTPQSLNEMAKLLSDTAL
jgi:DNA polymerase III delta subunit